MTIYTCQELMRRSRVGIQADDGLFDLSETDEQVRLDFEDYIEKHTARRPYQHAYKKMALLSAKNCYGSLHLLTLHSHRLSPIPIVRCRLVGERYSKNIF